MIRSYASPSGYIFTLLGSVIGLSNILSFATQSYKYGGGAYLLPYLIAYAAIGLPLICLEAVIGKKLNMPHVTAYRFSGAVFGKYMAWMAVMASITITAFYILMTGYASLYTYFSAMRSIPPDTATFFNYKVLHLSTSLGDFGSFTPMLFLGCVPVIALTYFVLLPPPPRRLEWISKAMVMYLFIIGIVFSFLTLRLPGGVEGVIAFFTPRFDALLRGDVWVSVFRQLFFSLSLGLGIIPILSRFAPKNYSILKASYAVAFGDIAISLISSCVIFASLGFYHQQSGVPLSDLAASKSIFENAFVIIPKIIQLFSPITQSIAGVLFFISFVFAGATSIFSLAEVGVSSIERELCIPRKNVLFGYFCFIVFAVAVLCFGNAHYVLKALAPLIMGVLIIAGCLLEVVTFLVRPSPIRNDTLWERASGWKTPMYYILLAIVPVALVFLLCGQLMREVTMIEPAFIVRGVWLVFATLGSYGLISFTQERLPHAPGNTPVQDSSQTNVLP